MKINKEDLLKYIRSKYPHWEEQLEIHLKDCVKIEGEYIEMMDWYYNCDYRIIFYKSDGTTSIAYDVGKSFERVIFDMDFDKLLE